MDDNWFLEIEPFSLQGWEAFRLSNEYIAAVCVPEIGGRMMQFSLDGRDCLFMNPDLLGKRFTYEEHAGDGTILNWKNYGGDKTWPAPQGWDGEGQWPGPPDPVLDSGRYDRYRAESFRDAAIVMTSPHDERSGLQIERKIGLERGSSRLTLDLSFYNFSMREVRWAIWDVAQLHCATAAGEPSADCWLYIPVDAARTPAYDVMFGDNNAQYQLDAGDGLLAVRYMGMVGKIGVHSPAGWIAFCDGSDDFALVMQFPYDAEAEYPDNGATVECWTEAPDAPSPIPIKSPGHILEAEILGPLTTMQLGESAELRVVWSAARCPGPIVAVNDVGCAHELLSAAATGGRWHVRGVYGCFHGGRAELALLDDAGDVVARRDLGEVSPLAALRIDETIDPPDGTCEARVDVVNEDGEPIGTLPA